MNLNPLHTIGRLGTPHHLRKAGFLPYVPAQSCRCPESRRGGRNARLVIGVAAWCFKRSELGSRHKDVAEGTAFVPDEAPVESEQRPKDRAPRPKRGA